MAESYGEERRGLGVLDWFENTFLTRFLRFLAPYAIVLASVPFFIDLDYKSSEREAQAWQTVTTPASGNSGKIAALEYLNFDRPLAIPNPRLWNIPLGPTKALREDGIPKRWIWLRNYGPWKLRTPLVGIDLSQKKDPVSGIWLGAPTYLEGINLRDAELSRSDFTAAAMRGANLSESHAWRIVFANTNLEEANFTNADLPRSDFSNARLQKADFTGARLKDAIFLGADLRGAKLADATELTQAQIDETCTDAETILPPGLHPPVVCNTSERGWLIRGDDGLPTRAIAGPGK